MMFMFLKRSSQLIQLSYLYRRSCSFSPKASKTFGFKNEATPCSSVEYKGATGNVNISLGHFPLLSDSGDNVKDYKIELIDNQTWSISTGLADAWRGVEQTKTLRNDVVDEFAAYVPPSKNDPDFDDIEDMKIRGNLFYEINKESKEYEEYNFKFHGKKSSKKKGAKIETKNEKPSRNSNSIAERSSKNKGAQNETKKEKPSRNSNSIAERSSKNRDGQKESKMKQNVTGFSLGSGKLHNVNKININENYHQTSSFINIHGYGDEKKLRTPTFNQLTAAYHEPFCLDIFISNASARACIVHRATSKVVAVAHSISKDMKSDFGSTRYAAACAAVGKVLAQRALADDIHNAVYTPRKGDKLEGKLLIVLESVIKSGVHVKVKLKKRNFKKSGLAPTARNFNADSVAPQLWSSQKFGV